MEMQTFNHWWHAAVFLVICFVCGCSENGLDKVVLHGKVNFDGKPLPTGQIRFVPMEGTHGPKSGAVIIDGAYVAEGKGGVPLGNHRVEIQAYRPVGGRVPAAMQAEGGPTEPYLPARYNGQSILTVEVTEDSGSQSIDFDLEP
jgi:hypothetical protein